MAMFAARLRTAALSVASLHGTARQSVLLLYCWASVQMFVSGSESQGKHYKVSRLHLLIILVGIV